MGDQPRATRRTMAALALLGFSSGLPYLLSSVTLQAWLERDGVGLAALGFLALVTLPYSLKFLIAPVVDRFTLPWLGRRRGWILLTQLACAVAILAMTLADPSSDLRLVAAVATSIAAASATQDVVIDACRADALPEREAGVGVAIFLAGYRLGVLATKGLAFVAVGALLARIGTSPAAVDRAWRLAYLACAALMAVGVVGTLLLREPPRPSAAPATIAGAVVRPIGDLFERYGGVGTAWLLLLCVFFRLPDGLVANMTVPFLRRAGVGEAAIGVVNGIAGIPTTIAGTVFGAAMLRRVPISSALLWFGALQAIGCATYAALGMLDGSPTLAYAMPAAVLVEDFCSGLATAAFVSFLTTRCTPAYSATQYAVLTSVVALGRTVLSAHAGVMAQRYGWAQFFAIAAASAAPGLLLVLRCVPRPATAAEPS